MAGVSSEVADEVDSTGVMLESRVVKTLRCRHTYLGGSDVVDAHVLFGRLTGRDDSDYPRRSPGTPSVGAMALGSCCWANASQKPFTDQNSGMSTPAKDRAMALCRYVDASPSPYHAVEESVRRLTAAGFTELHLDDPPTTPGRRYLRNGGALVAWSAEDRETDAPLRIVGAHTDSPNLRVKPNPNRTDQGFKRVGVEVYGSALLNSWLDRDLGLSGRVMVRDGNRDSAREVLVREDRPVARIPQLAIHLDRGVNEKGLILDPQSDLAPVVGLGDSALGCFEGLLAKLARVSVTDVLAWDAMFHDVVPATLAGLNGEFVSAPRLDDLLSCHAGTEALVDASDSGGSCIPVLALFDHEEVGSQTATGAAGPLLPHALIHHLGQSDRASASSLVLSVDGAHCTHPSRGDRHDPEHQVRLNGGPVLKINAQARYASDAPGLATVRLAAERVGISLQSFASRNDLACGSTIGPTLSTRTGLRTVDLGVAQLAMHSAREFCGSSDPSELHALLVELLNS